MIRSRRPVAVLTCTLGALLIASPRIAAGAAPATGGQAALRATFEARYAEMKEAMEHRDPKEVAALWTVDFVSEDAEGKADTAAAMLKSLAAIPVDPSKVSETKILSVSVKGDVATVEQHYHMTTMRPKQGSTTEKQKGELNATSTDTWLRSGKTWLLQRTVTKQIDYDLAGRRVLHKVHP
ncbi:MAG: nuclear transport factor 2 family protein [Acidobacteriota bacterium]